MVAETRGKFACGSCGKTLVWKVEQAGKRVKCSCGGVTTVPPTPLGMVGAAVAGAQSLPPPPPTAQLAPAATLGYISARKRVSEAAELPIDKLIDPKRDIYVPTGILVVGFLAIGLWALVGRGISAQIPMLVL